MVSIGLKASGSSSPLPSAPSSSSSPTFPVTHVINKIIVILTTIIIIIVFCSSLFHQDIVRQFAYHFRHHRCHGNNNFSHWPNNAASDWPFSSRDQNGCRDDDRHGGGDNVYDNHFLKRYLGDEPLTSDVVERRGGICGIASFLFLIFSCLAIFNNHTSVSSSSSPSSSSSSSSSSSLSTPSLELLHYNIISRIILVLSILTIHLRSCKFSATSSSSSSPPSLPSKLSSSPSSSSSSPSLQDIPTRQSPSRQSSRSRHPSATLHQSLPPPSNQHHHRRRHHHHHRRHRQFVYFDLEPQFRFHHYHRRRKFTELIFVVIVIASCFQLPMMIESTMTSCSRNQWHDSSRRCSENMVSVLEEIRVSDHGNEMRLNMTCREWDKTNACFQQLIQRCSSDPFVIQNLNDQLGRFIIYSLPCRDPIKYQRAFSECLLPELRSTKACTDAIDRYLHKFVARREFRSACRVVTTSIRCFHNIKSNIKNRCSHDDSAEEYHHDFIQPLVDQTRAIVLAHCSLSPPYKQYFVQSPPSAALSSTSTSSHRQPITAGYLVTLPLAVFYYSQSNWL